MSWLEILQKVPGAVRRTASTYPFETALLVSQVGLAGGAAAMAQKGYRTALNRADRVRQLGAMDRQLAAIDASRRLSTIRASNASPGYAMLGVRGTYGSPVDALMYAEAAELKQIERMEMAHRFLVKDIEEDAKALRTSGFFGAGQTLLGAAAQYGMNLRLGRIEKEGMKLQPVGIFDAPQGMEKKVEIYG